MWQNKMNITSWYGVVRNVHIHRIVGWDPSCRCAPDLSPLLGACTGSAVAAGGSRDSAEAGHVPVGLAPDRVAVAVLPGRLALGLGRGVALGLHSQMLCLAYFESSGRPCSHSFPNPVRMAKLAAGAERRGCR